MASQDSFPASIPTEIASTLQAGHIRPDPDPAVDMAPSTAADAKAVYDEKQHHQHNHPYDSDSAAHQLDGIDGDSDSDEEDDIPYSVLKRPRRQPQQQLPPLPDLRFEQSYLKSIAAADTWWKVALITTRDQVLMPLAQGVVYNLLLCGWQQWNRTAKLQGNSAGARFRRWWYGVNNWVVPGDGQHRKYRR